MSLILEALRRSEAERRRAAPPSLLGELPSSRPPRPLGWPMALAGLLVGLLLATAVAWWWTARSASPPGARDAPDAQAKGGDEVVPRPEPVPAAAHAPLPAEAPTARIRIVAPPTAPAAPPIAEPTPRSTPRERPEPVADGAVSAPSSLGPADGDLRWADVADGMLPTMRVSMHVYAEDPARRFAIIDGQRVREGDAVQPGLVLVEIRRDGLRLRWQERVLWVPR